MNMNNNKNRDIEKNVTNSTETEGCPAYSFYSRVLNKPFDSVAELKVAEQAHFEQIRAKEDKAATKKADALKVEAAFKAMNAARKTYKEALTALTATYSENLTKLKAGFETERAVCQAELAKAEAAYSTALKAFTDKYPEGYHLTLKDGDFETTIESKNTAKANPNVFDIFDLFFNI